MTELDEQVALKERRDEIDSDIEEPLHTHGHAGFGNLLSKLNNLISSQFFYQIKHTFTPNTRLENVKLVCGCINPTPSKKLCGSHLAMLLQQSILLINPVGLTFCFEPQDVKSCFGYFFYLAGRN